MFYRQPKYTGPERRKTPRRRPRPLRALLILLLFSVLAYAGVVMWLIRQETQLVLRAGRAPAEGRPPFPVEEVTIPRPDGARQIAWVARPPGSHDRPWVLYLHGNPTTIASQVNIAHYRVLRNAGLNVLAPEYRGFGGLEGTPREASLAEDAAHAYEYLAGVHRVPAGAVLLYGWSLGSAVAVDLASKRPAAGMILEGAPASLLDLAGRHYPFFPLRLFARSSFDSIRRIGGVRMPLLFLHSTGDEVVPIAEGRRLYAAAPGPKTFVELRGGHLDAIERDAARFEDAIREFLSTNGLVSGGRLR